MCSGAMRSDPFDSASWKRSHVPVKPAPWRNSKGGPSPARRTAVGVPATSIFSAATPAAGPCVSDMCNSEARLNWRAGP